MNYQHFHIFSVHVSHFLFQVVQRELYLAIPLLKCVLLEAIGLEKAQKEANVRAERVQFNLIAPVLLLVRILVLFPPFVEVSGPFLVDLLFLLLGAYLAYDKIIDEVRDVEPVHD